MSSSSPQLVDDTTPAVQYAPGWIWDQLVDEVDNTRHGAAIAGLTASLGFSGTGIAVVGTLGSSDTNGQPKTTYTIDGTVVGTYNAPVTPSGQTHYNVTFFSKQDLSPGDHEITITNVDGTSPNHYWLDYFLIYKSPPANIQPATTTTTTKAPSPPATQPPTTTTHSFPPTVTTTTSQNPTTTSTIASSPSSSISSTLSSLSSANTALADLSTNTVSNSTIASTSAGLSQNTDTSIPSQVSQTTGIASGSSAANPTTSLPPVGANVSQQGGSPVNIGAIAGGAVGGVVLLILLLMIFFLWRRRHQRARQDIEPFGPAMSQQDQYAFAQQGVATSRSNTNSSGHAAKSPDMYFNQSAFASRRPAPTGSEAGFESHTEIGDDAASMHADYSRPNFASGGTAAILNTHTRPSPSGAHSPAATKAAQESTIYTSSSPTSASSTAHLVPSRYQPTSPQSDSATSPVTPGSATSLLLHTEVARAPWYAPPQGQSRAQSLLRALTGGRGSSTTGSVVQDVDSGLRTYNEATLPPPYTPE